MKFTSLTTRNSCTPGLTSSSAKPWLVSANRTQHVQTRAEVEPGRETVQTGALVMNCANRTQDVQTRAEVEPGRETVQTGAFVMTSCISTGTDILSKGPTQ